MLIIIFIAYSLGIVIMFSVFEIFIFTDKFKEMSDDQQSTTILCSLFWCITLPFMIMYSIISIIMYDVRRRIYEKNKKD